MSRISFKTKQKKQNQQEESLQLITFCVANEHFAVKIKNVREIKSNGNVTPVPNAQIGIEGFLHIGHEIIPIIDLRESFSKQKACFGSIIITNDKQSLGFIVDVVNEIITIPVNLVTKIPNIVTDIDASYVDGVVFFEDKQILLISFKDVVPKAKIQNLLEFLSSKENKNLLSSKRAN